VWIALNYQNIDRPAPNLSTSYSFNEKMLFLAQHEGEQQIDVLSLGSSMSLNNLHSRTITEIFGTEEYINTASWGANMQENFALLQILEPIYEPKTLIIATNLCDFKESTKTIRYDMLDDYLRSEDKSSILCYLRTFDLHYYITNAKYSKLVRNNPSAYEFLGYDMNGGVNMQGDGFHIDPKRWNGDTIFDQKIDPVWYQYLDSISLFCKAKEIELLIFQSPMRNGYMVDLNENGKAAIGLHIDRIKRSSKDHFTFVNAMDTTWSDPLFVDWIHLNEKGAELFTEYCFRNSNK